MHCSQDLMFTMKSVMGGQRGRGQERSMKVSEARAVLEDVEAERLVSEDMVRATAVSWLSQAIDTLAHAWQ
jgi:ATP-dependent protease HslVU (ClpYQ) ATPase subunit